MLANEELLTLSEAASRMPRINGKKFNPRVLWRWARQGMRGVRLEHDTVGGRVVTSVEAIRRFEEALEVARAKPTEGRKEALTEAEKALERAGL